MKNVLYIALLLLAWGCAPAGGFSVEEVTMPQFYGLKSVHGRATVSSDAPKDLVIESAYLVVRHNDRELAAARLMLPITVKAGGQARVRYDLALENLSVAKLQALQTRMLTSPAQVVVDVSGWVRYGKMRKKVVLESVPVMTIIANFGALKP